MRTIVVHSFFQISSKYPTEERLELKINIEIFPKKSNVLSTNIGMLAQHQHLISLVPEKELSKLWCEVQI